MHRLRQDFADSQYQIVAIVRVGTWRRFEAGLKQLVSIKRLDCVIIAGGDGTIATVLNGLIRRTQLHIGLLPAGTGNSFARSLGLPLDYEAASAVIKAGKTRQAAVGTINGQVFVNAAAIGLSATSAAHISDTTKRYFGRLAYFISGAKYLAGHRPFEVTIKLPRSTHQFKTHELLINNGSFHGGNVIDHHTSAYKNYLTFTALGVDESRWQYIKSQWHIRQGNHRQDRTLFSVSAAQATITTKPRRRIHADGEVISRTPAEFKIKPSAITVFVP